MKDPKYLTSLQVALIRSGYEMGFDRGTFFSFSLVLFFHLRKANPPKDPNNFKNSNLVKKFKNQECFQNLKIATISTAREQSSEERFHTAKLLKVVSLRSIWICIKHARCKIFSKNRHQVHIIGCWAWAASDQALISPWSLFWRGKGGMGKGAKESDPRLGVGGESA